ncbi:MAG TPA: rhomboid family intramembrane serine protease [Burkholderiaceae bacterium]|jgi:membrane associated rhomboid family serine protease|nr:rhomboid family intramembrane serine protease [Burkholderiaceae bacterium]
MFNLPAGTRSLLLINVAVFLLQLSGGSGALVTYFALWPVGTAAFEPWQLLTYGFLHGSVLHLFSNMLALVMFGGDVERVWGRNRFLTYYFVCVLSAGLTQSLVNYLTGSFVETIGASGGVFGLLLAFGMMYPRRMILLIFPPIPMPAWLFVTLYGVFELYAGVTGAMGDVAHFAHLGGMLGGYLLIRYGRARRR